MSPKDYAQLLYEILESKSASAQEKILDNFESVLIRNKESYLAPAIEKEFEKIQRWQEQEKITYISSATELTASQKKELESTSKEPREFSQNPSLLGGIAVRQRDIVYNATLRKKIEAIK